MEVEAETEAETEAKAEPKSAMIKLDTLLIVIALLEPYLDTTTEEGREIWMRTCTRCAGMTGARSVQVA